MSLSAGTRLGPYEITSQLGAGGMGEVYRAHDARLDREVAIKVLPPSFANDTDRLRRFEQEARATSALNHPNILRVYDIGTHDGSAYIVSELLDGEELRAQLNDGTLSVRRALDYAQQIPRASRTMTCWRCRSQATTPRACSCRPSMTNTTSDEGGLNRFQQLALAVSKLNHPNILTVYAIGTDDGKQLAVTHGPAAADIVLIRDFR